MPQYPNPPPPGIRRSLWTFKIRLEATFGLAMLQEWEKALVYCTVLLITSIFWISVISYLPGQLRYMARRFAYYVLDDENASVWAVLKEWMAEQVGKGSAGSGSMGDGASGGRVEL